MGLVREVGRRVALVGWRLAGILPVRRGGRRREGGREGGREIKPKSSHIRRHTTLYHAVYAS